MAIKTVTANNVKQVLLWMKTTQHHAMSRIEVSGHITLIGYSDVLNVPIKLWYSSLEYFKNTPKNEPQIFIPNIEGEKLLTAN